MGDPLPMKQCTNASCASKNMKVRTDRDTCLLCDRKLTSPFDLGNLNLDGDLSDLLGGIFGKGRPR